jgi:hypothetical protein
MFAHIFEILGTIRTAELSATWGRGASNDCTARPTFDVPNQDKSADINKVKLVFKFIIT